MRKTEIILSQIQFDRILELFNQFNFSDSLAQFVVATFAILGGFFAQKHFTNKDSQENFLKKINHFNHATIYTSTVIEEFGSHIDFLFRQYNHEVNALNLIKNPSYSINIVPPLGAVEIDKFLDETIEFFQSHNEAVQCIYRIKNASNLFNKINENRDYLIKHIYAVQNDNSQSDIQIENAIRKSYQDIHQRTLVLLTTAEVVFDGCIFLQHELEKISQEIKNNNKKLTNLKIKVISPNLNHEKIRLRLMNFIDSLPQYKERFLHMRPAESNPTLP